MMKQAWRSYLASLHPRNIKNINVQKSVPWFAIVYWLILNPIIGANQGRFDYWTYIGFLTIKAIPIIVLAWSNILGRLSISKAVYLTPMKEEERLEYLKYLMLIKIAVPAILSIVLNIIWGIWGETNILLIALIAFIYVSIGIGSYMCSDLVNKYNRHIPHAVRDKDGEPKDAWWNIFITFFGIVLLVGLEAGHINGTISITGEDILPMAIVGGIVAVLAIGDIVIVKTRYKATLQDLCNYEVTHHIKIRK